MAPSLQGFECPDHSGHDARIRELERNRDSLWDAHDRLAERIDSMKNWVIAGMGGLLVQTIFFILGGLYMMAKWKGGF